MSAPAERVPSSNTWPTEDAAAIGLRTRHETVPIACLSCLFVIHSTVESTAGKNSSRVTRSASDTNVSLIVFGFIKKGHPEIERCPACRSSFYGRNIYRKRRTITPGCLITSGRRRRSNTTWRSDQSSFQLPIHARHPTECLRETTSIGRKKGTRSK